MSIENELKDKTEKWIKNKEVLGAHCKVISDDKSSLFTVRFENIQRKYAKAAKLLVNDVISLAVEYMAKKYSLNVFSEDSKAEGARVREFLEGNKTELLNILLEYGYDVFMSKVREDTIILQMQYDVRTMKRTSDGWIRWDGTVLDEKSLQEMPFIPLKKKSNVQAECC